jgi:hypothetical protein
MSIGDATDAVRAAAKALTTDGVDTGDHARAYFAAWERLLSLYYPLPSGLSDPVGLPPDLAKWMGGLCGYLATGKIPDLILDCRKPGNKQPGPTERRDIQIAVAYVAAAKSGAIVDNQPVKTVSIAYGVSRRTVQGWRESYPAVNCAAKLLFEGMEQAGARYRVAGRSRAAIQGRDARQLNAKVRMQRR